MIRVTTGYDFILDTTLKKSKATFNIASNAVIKVKLIDVSRTVSLTNEVILDNNASGNDLANSKIIVHIPNSETTLISDYGTAVLIIHLEDNGIKETWEHEVEIIKGMF